MSIGEKSKKYLKQIRAKAKMYEYRVKKEFHDNVDERANELILPAIGIIGDITDEICSLEDSPIRLSQEKEENLYFVARFFDSYFQSKLSPELSQYYILMGAVTYYLCNMNGSSKVMMSIMQDLCNFEFDASGLENVVMWLLGNNQEFNLDSVAEKYREFIERLVGYHNSFFDCTSSESFDFNEFRKSVYRYGNPTEILLIDIIIAILKKKISNSCISLMPKYSGVNIDLWASTFCNNGKIKEMWESQILLGEHGIFKGKSGVIQMPTSSGKTTSLSLAIQSAFLSKRTSTVIVVAPFRALCREIMFDIGEFFSFDKEITIAEFSDIPETSEQVLNTVDSIGKKIFVMTPEKMVYILKHKPQLIENINMIVFDEAHLFDDQARGTDYELLLTTINNYISPDAQKILVSAVISKAEQLNSWINRGGIGIHNNLIKTPEKSVAINTCKDGEVGLSFIDPIRNLEQEFYVPRVVKKSKLKKLDGEKKDRYFPDSANKHDLSIFYAIKLIKNGSVAIFCTRKDSVYKVLERFIDLRNRGVSLDEFGCSLRNEECLKIANLIEKHLGKENPLFKSASCGIVGHHSGVPNGIRIAEEYALKESLIQCVVCTSTLAQGVNLPIKYLIVSSINQSGNTIKVRDFHNLIGRTARAGKETEGTIILTDDILRKKFEYNQYKHLLNANNAEECSSNLLKLVRDIKLGNQIIFPKEMLENYIKFRYTDRQNYIIVRKRIEDRSKRNNIDFIILKKIDEIDRVLVSLENFLIGFTDQGEDEYLDTIQTTYGYFLANEEEKNGLERIYTSIKNYIEAIEDSEKKLYRKSLLGFIKMKELIEFIIENFSRIDNADFDLLINLIADRLIKSVDCKVIPKLCDNRYVKEILKMWIEGESYIQIYNAYSEKVQMKYGQRTRKISLSDVITLCDSDFGYASLNTIQSLIEILEDQGCCEKVLDSMNDILFRIRYGLPNIECVRIYELGFADRVISQEIASIIDKSKCGTKNKTKNEIRGNKEKIKEILLEYPAYYMARLSKI